MPRIRQDNDARYALRASFVDADGNVLQGDTITIGGGSDTLDDVVQRGNTANADVNINGKLTVTDANYDNHLELNRASEQWRFSPSTDGSLDVRRVAGTATASFDIQHNTVITGNCTATAFYGDGSNLTGIDTGAPSNMMTTDTTQNVTGIKEFQDNIQLRFGNSADMRMWWTTSDMLLRSYSHGGRFLFQGEDAGGTNRALLYMDPGTGGIELYHGGGKKAYTYSGGWRVTGNLLATSDVYAYYSDVRLKDVVGAIERPLESIGAIDTFYYTHNDKARELGYEGAERQVGVSAQSVQAVLPEVIGRAPIDDDGEGGSVTGEDYITVKYERIVPLLIEGIKELTSELESVRLELKELKREH